MERDREKDRRKCVETDRGREVTEKEGNCWKCRTEYIIYQNYTEELCCTRSVSVTHTHTL